MPEMNRRKFLLASAGIGAAGLLSGAVAVSWPELMREASERPLAEGSGVLVILTLYGGNDGINTVIPYADNAYHDARPESGLRRQAMYCTSDDQLGLNPALKGMAQAVDGPEAGDRARRRLPASPTTATSGRWTSGRPPRPPNPVSTGWIGRWLDATGDDPLRAVNIGSVLPPLAVGEKCTAAALTASEKPRARGQVRRDDGRARRRRPARHPGDGGGLRRRTARPAPPTRPFGSIGDRPAESTTRWPASSAWCGGGQGGGAHPGVRGAAGRLRHPRRRTRHPAALLQTLDEARDAVPAADGQRPVRQERRACWRTRSSAAGWRPTPRRAPTTAPPARCSSPARRSRAASTATNPA